MCWPYDSLVNKHWTCTKMWIPRCAKTTTILESCSVLSPFSQNSSQDVSWQCQIQKRRALNSTKDEVCINSPSCHVGWRTNRKAISETGGKERPSAFLYPALPTAISTRGNQCERRACRNKHKILHWQEGTYWPENFPVLVKAWFPIQPNAPDRCGLILSIYTISSVNLNMPLELRLARTCYPPCWSPSQIAKEDNRTHWQTQEIATI